MNNRMNWGYLLFEMALVLGYALFIYWVSSQTSILPLHLPAYQIDKVLHLSAFGLLGFLLGWPAYRMTGSFFWSIWLAAVLGGFYGISDEVHQSFVPGRFSDVYDIYADMLGSLLGGLFWWRVKRRQDVKEIIPSS